MKSTVLFSGVVGNDTVKSGGYGNSVALNAAGTIAVVGAPGELHNGYPCGLAYVYEYLNGTWEFTGNIKPPKPEAIRNFGKVVDIDDEGKYIVITADDRAMVFMRHSTLMPSNVVSLFNTPVIQYRYELLMAEIMLPNNGFGHAASISGDGKTVAVGAPYTKDHYSHIPGANNQGVVHVYRREGDSHYFRYTTIVHGNPFEGFRFGWSLDLTTDGLRLIVGIGPNPSLSHSAVYVYDEGKDGKWEEAAGIKPLVNDPAYTFGTSVAISGDGMRAAASGYFNPMLSEEAQRLATLLGNSPTNSKAAVVPQLIAQIMQFCDGHWDETVCYQSSSYVDDGGIEGNTFVSMSKNGRTVVIGGYGDMAGRAFLYQEFGKRAVYVAEHVSVMAPEWSSDTMFSTVGPALQEDARRKQSSFGRSIALSADGGIVFIGGTERLWVKTKDGDNPCMGRAHLYVL